MFFFRISNQSRNRASILGNWASHLSYCSRMVSNWLVLPLTDCETTEKIKSYFKYMLLFEIL